MITVSVTRAVAVPSPAQPRDVGLHVPATGEFVQLIHDWEPELKSEFGLKPRRTNIPYPSTRMLWGENTTPPSGFIPMFDDWQMRQLELMQWSAPNAPIGEPFAWFVVLESEKKKFVPKETPGAYPYYPVNSLLGAYQRLIEDHRVLTDGNAYDTFGEHYRDINLPANLSNSKPWRQKALDMTGNILRVIDDTSGMTDSQISNMIKVEALNGLLPAPPLEWILANKPWCVHWATEQSVVQLADDRWVVARFPQLKIFDSGVPFFVLAKKNWNLIDKKHVRRIANGAQYSPYVPEKF